MKFRRSSSGHGQPKYIRLNTHNCQACWTCIEACPQRVLGKVDFLGHRHAKIVRADACNGCKKCVRACLHNAIEYTYHPVPVEDRKPSISRR